MLRSNNISHAKIISMIRSHVVNFFVFCCIVFLAAPTLVHGAAGLVTVVPDDCRGNGGCQSVCDIAQLAQNILNDGIYIAVFLSAILFAWAGFRYLTNVANSGAVSRAKEIFVNVAIGLVIILASWLLIDTVMKTLVGNGSSFGPWNQICMLFLQSAGFA
jgi:hypothetical protein